MQAVVGEHALDTAAADGEVGLAQFLGDDLGGGVGVQKAVTQDLTDGLVGTAVIRFGSGFLRLEGRQAAALKGVQDLVIALAAITIFLGDGGDVSVQTLAFDQHEETAGQVVGGINRQGAGWAGELVGMGLEKQRSIHGARIAWLENMSI